MKKKAYFYLTLLIVFIVSCQQEELKNEKNGYLQFTVEKNASTIPMTRATELPIALQVVDKSGNVIKETEDWNNWESTPIELPSGTYTIKAFSKGVSSNSARFSEPYYAGQTEVTVTPKVNQSVNIECKLADVKVTVSYNSDVKKYFSGLNCKVKNTSGELDFGKEETRSGYFVAEDLNVALALTNIDGKSFVLNSDPITNVTSRQHYHINYSIKTSGSVGDISITLDPSTKEYNVDILIPKEGAPVISTWATFADVSLSTSETSTNIACKYRVSDTEDWSSISGEQVQIKDGKISAKISGLASGTKYDFCFAIDGKNGKIATATTENAPQLSYSNFDSWYQNGQTIYMGNASEGTNSYWDSGNAGGSLMSKNPTASEDTDIHTSGGKAVKMVSQYVGVEIIKQGKFAAGNIYVGHYCETFTSGGYGARIRFGRPFESRPSQLKGWYKYTRGTDVKYGSDPYNAELKNSGGDQCAIYIALADHIGLDGDFGKTAFEINNHGSDNPANFVYKNSIDLSENNKNIIAYGSITNEEAKGSFDEEGKVVWKQFSIDLKYRDLNRKPKYIIVVASASKYGDFFTGAPNSTLLIDDFELVYGVPVTAK